MIVKVLKHVRPNLVVLQAGPDMAPTMGRYRQARYEGEGAYLLELEHLETVTRDLTRLGHTVLDERSTGGPGLGPLPECRECRHPVARTASPSACPHCGSTPWRPVTFDGVEPKDRAQHLQRARGHRPAERGRGGAT